ncbi:hypothetical protein LCGC14_1858780 [marine sediment metagenome]|uniref:Uncharacterized protein n=1 Tax=marine sediment metagenome TaxID=412755 RepID=A0A0F9G7Y4_9ZZZZ
MAKTLKRPALTYDEVHEIRRSIAARIVKASQNGSNWATPVSDIMNNTNLISALAKMNEVRRK